MQNHELLVFYCGHQSKVHVRKWVSTNRQLIVANLIYITLRYALFRKESEKKLPCFSFPQMELNAILSSSHFMVLMNKASIPIPIIIFQKKSYKVFSKIWNNFLLPIFPKHVSKLTLVLDEILSYLSFVIYTMLHRLIFSWI